ncbi:MAG: histidine phosphatase family protein [Christensenellaceae bacterium]|jgi:broad specificity phosphatase PhoE|nr:histidine phosphatase family protein [Christensenellaceae bacterium]
MIYYIRHGQSERNVRFKQPDYNPETYVNRRIADRNTKITEVGKEQAKAAAENFKGIKFDKVYCSPFLRARETCEIILRTLGLELEPIIDERLREWQCPDGMTDAQQWEKYKADNNKEMFEDLVKNYKPMVYEFLDELKKTYHGEDILIVGHQTSGMVLRGYFEGEPKDNDYSEFNRDCPNCHIFKWEFK